MSRKTELINLASEMVRGVNMPSPYSDDWSWYRSTPMAERRVVLARAEKASEQCKVWALAIRKIADSIPD